jgi:hypothetical protein
MSEGAERRLHAGDRVDDLCRACKTMRTHTVVAVGGEPVVVRVLCGYCGSQHNYRGGDAAAERDARRAARLDTGRTGNDRRESDRPGERTGESGAERQAGGAAARHDDDGVLPLVAERERRYPQMSDETGPEGGVDFEMLLRRVIREEMGLGPAVPADKWRGGDLVLRPGKPGLQEKVWPIETFFHKVVMLRNRLRVLEQQINGMEFPDDQKVKLQGYITACYGTLTSFNVLFAEEDDRFRGSGGDA